jgi:hypothetical protein
MGSHTVSAFLGMLPGALYALFPMIVGPGKSEQLHLRPIQVFEAVFLI